MKKLFTLLLGFLFCTTTIFAQTEGQNSTQELNLYGSPNTPIDNTGHWEDMAKKGIVKRNPTIPVKPATKISYDVLNPKGLQNSPDVLIIDVGTNVQSENSVFADPNNRDNALNSNNSGFNGGNYILTSDGGLTWAGSTAGAGGSDKGDPATCIGLNGRQYIGSINLSRKQVVSYSDDGASWAKVNVESGSLSYPDLYDKNHLWIDNTNSGQEGNLYDAWTCFVSGDVNDSDIEFTRSTNDGTSWSTPINISNAIAAGNHNQGVNIKCNNTGWVFATWAVYDDWGGGLYNEDAIGFARSADGGLTFSSANRIVSNIKGIRESASNANSTGKNMRVNSFPSMALDVSGGPNHGDIYIVWANIGTPGTNTGTNVSVYMVKSTNGGVAWSTPSRINTVAASNHAAYMPWITCDPVTGNLYTIFYDDRNFTDASSEVEAWVAFSDDGGTSWTDMSVSDVSFTPSPIPGFATGYFGDYLGISAYDGKVYPVWTDNRSGRALAYTSPLDFGCSASGGGSEYISGIEFGSIDNPTASGNYTDYTAMSNDLPLNATEDITVSVGNYFSNDQCGIWVDWNRDDDFDDPNETIAVSGPVSDQFSASIAVPAGTTLGQCTMRVRVTWTGAVEPCGSTSYGEVEDYTINVTPNAPNEWTGAFNSYWHNDNNWSLGHIPTADEDVIITSAGFQPPKVDVYDEECNGLTIQNGGTLNIEDQELIINGGLSISGTLGMIDNSSVIRCFGHVAWNSGSNANFSANSVFWAYADWNFNLGSNANLADGNVDFTGTGISWIRCYSANSSFNTIGIYKGGANSTRYSNLSSEDLVLNSMFVQPSGVFNCYANHDIVFMGSGLSNHGICNLTNNLNSSTLRFNGSSQGLNYYAGSSGNINNVVFNSSNSTTLNGNIGIVVKGGLTIETGTFNSNGFPVEVSGGWSNNGGTYSANNSVVTFNGDGIANPHNINGTSTFYDIVHLNTGSYLRFNDANTISNNLELHGACWAYDALSIGGTLNINDPVSVFSVFSDGNVTVASLDQGGKIVVSNNSFFTANDIVESGIEGEYQLTSGEINLTQDAGSVPDFRADITIEDGQFTLNGGNGTSWWAYSGNASLTMSGGIFDFNNSGCNIYNSPNTLTLNITGGTIRSAGNFTVANPAFTPSAGLVELYSASDANLSTTSGSNLYNVHIDKGAKSGNSIYKLSERDIAAGIKSGGGKSPLANQISLTSDIDINGDFTIDAGTFNTSSYDMTVAGDWTNNVGIGGFIENSNNVTFDGGSSADITTDETFYDLSLDKSINSYNGLNLNVGITANVLNNLQIIDGGLEMNNNSTLDVNNNVGIALNAGLNANDFGVLLYIGGNWTNDNTFWNSSGVGYKPGTEIITFDGNADQFITTNADREDFGNLVVNKASGEFRSNNNINVMHDFTLTQGLWHDNAAELTHYFQGDFYITSGLSAGWSSLTSNTVVFKGIGDQTVFNPFGYGYFYKVIIDKTDFAKKKNTPGEGSEIAEEKESPNLKPEGGQKAMMVNLISTLDIQNGLNPGLTIDEGILNLNGNTFWTQGDININDGGKLIVDDGAILKVDDAAALNVNSGGFLEVIGSVGNNAKISNRNTGFYNFTVKPAGTISANEATFEDLWINGVFVMAGATIDPSNAFTNCTFRNGSPGNAGLLGLNSTQTLTLTGLKFPANTGGTDFNIWKLTNAGNFTIEAATGVFSGPEFEFDNFNRIHWGDIDIELDLTVLLEGPFNGIDMNTDLRDNGVLPLSQPFNTYPFWYTGSENVGSIPINVVDWVLIELRDSDNPANANASSIFEKQAAFLLSDGSIVDLDGSSPLTYTTSYDQKMYPVILQLNHLAVISGTNLQRDAAGVYTFDFTNGDAFGGIAGQKEVAVGVWAMFGGDGSGNGSITSGDINSWEFDSGNQGYLYGDYNLDSEADNKDKNDICVQNIGESSQVNQPEKATSGNNTRLIKN